MVQSEGNRSVSRGVKHYRLDAVLAVGFRVRSHRGTQFRRWANDRLREYLVKGFAMDDERLKHPGSPGAERYFGDLDSCPRRGVDAYRRAARGGSAEAAWCGAPDRQLRLRATASCGSEAARPSVERSSLALVWRGLRPCWQTREIARGGSRRTIPGSRSSHAE